MARHFPDTLAEHVHAQLLARNEQPPSTAVLTVLFETLYFVSLKREEGQPITCRVAFIRRERPDPFPPKRIVANRWQYVALDQELKCTVSNLAKLSTAVDPWGSTLAVDTDSDGALRIWGLIDQSVHYSTYVVKESSSGPEMPGMFQAVIQGPAEIAVYKTYLFLGSLKQDVLVKTQRRVFQAGPVHVKLIGLIARFQQTVRKNAGYVLYQERDHWDASLGDMWISVISRILIGIQRYGHGGALLISNTKAGLNPKYSLRYPRLSTALVRSALGQIRHTAYSDEIFEHYIDAGADDLPMDLYLDETVTQNEINELDAEITGCIRFIASLSRVDGLIWVDSRLQVRGFGVEITRRHDPPRAFLAMDSDATKRRALHFNHYGTRHRSMLRYCAAHSASIGFVVTQDGDVRAITQVNKDVVMWENIRL